MGFSDTRISLLLSLSCHGDDKRAEEGAVGEVLLCFSSSTVAEVG